MSFDEQPGLSLIQKFGCTAYAIIGGLISFYLMVAASVGDCASENDCPSDTTRALMFYGAPLLTLAGGALLIRYFTRDQN